jgi:hypothetical protein
VFESLSVFILNILFTLIVVGLDQGFSAKSLPNDDGDDDDHINGVGLCL